MQWSAVWNNCIPIHNVGDTEDTAAMDKPHFWKPVFGRSLLNAQNYSLEDAFPDQWTPLPSPIFVLPGFFSTSGSGLELGNFFTCFKFNVVRRIRDTHPLHCMIFPILFSPSLSNSFRKTGTSYLSIYKSTLLDKRHPIDIFSVSLFLS